MLSSWLILAAGEQPEGLTVVIELIRNLGLPTALLLAVAWYHMREIRRKEDAWNAERAALLARIDKGHDESLERERETIEALHAGAETAKAWETALREANAKGGGTARKL